MAEVIFNYEGANSIIQCNVNDKMKDIIDKFLIKINKKEDFYSKKIKIKFLYYFYYNGGSYIQL